MCPEDGRRAMVIVAFAAALLVPQNAAPLPAASSLESPGQRTIC